MQPPSRAPGWWQSDRVCSRGLRLNVEPFDRLLSKEMSSLTISVRVHLSENDYVDAVKAISARNRVGLVFLIAVATAASLCTFLVWLSGHGQEAFILFTTLVGGIVGGWIGNRGSVVRKAKRLFQQNKTLHRPYEVVGSAAGVTLISENGKSIVLWSDFHKSRELEGQFLLFLSDANFFIIPKRTLSNSALVDEFRRMLKEHIHDG